MAIRILSKIRFEIKVIRNHLPGENIKAQCELLTLTTSNARSLTGFQYHQPQKASGRLTLITY